MQEKNPYKELIAVALKLPKYKPKKFRPVSRWQRITETLTRPRNLRADAEFAYNIIASARRSEVMTLSQRVPMSKLHETMAEHVNGFTREAIKRGGLPLRVFVYDRFQSWIDFGHGRVLRIGVRIHQQTKERSYASFVVEEATDFDEVDLGIGLVADDLHQNNRKEPTIKSAVIWQD